jgi:hypothetical protein
MFELIEYLTGGKCIVFVGSGPSCEIGLPNWAGLSEILLQEIRKLNLHDVDTYEVLSAQQKFPELFDRAWTRISQKFVVDTCASALRDTMLHGNTYQFLADFDFLGYLTTNYDSILKRHLTERCKAALEYTNRKSEIELVDFENSTSIVKLHGSLDQADTIVLTESQYDEVMFDSKRDYLRSFMRGYLTTRRVLFVGYSVRDLDMQFLLKMSTFSLRRKTPLYAIVANATDDDRDEWDRKYNIRIIPYSSPDGRHSELKNVFEILRRYVALRGEPRPASSTLSLDVAQALFMWQKFQGGGADEARVDAFKSLVLSVFATASSPSHSITKNEIVIRVARIAHVDKRRIETAVVQAIDRATSAGFLRSENGSIFELTQTGSDLNRKSQGQFSALKDEFLLQAELDLRKLAPGASKEAIAKAKTEIIESIVTAFTERGAEIVQMAFLGEGDIRPTANLFKIINGRAGSLDPQLRYPFMHYVTDLLTRPHGVQERFLEYLSKAFFAIQALGLDPDGTRIRRDLISHHTLILDSNVLIPVLALNSANNHVILEILKSAKAAGLRLIVTPRVFDEAMNHFSWAEYHVSKFGEQSLEALSAALGRGQYKANAFLDGFILYCNDVHEITFPDYLEYCFEGKPQPKNLKSKLARLGIEYFSPNAIGSKNHEYYVVKEETANALKESREARPEMRKSEERIETESEVYATICRWIDIKPDNVSAGDWKCSFLTYSGYLNRIAQEGPYPVGRNINVRPDVLYEFIGRLDPSSGLDLKFKDVLLATYFHSAGHFIDKKKYAQFFSPLVRGAEEIYKGSLETFRRLVDSSLTANSLSSVEELERPYAIVSLKAQADDMLRAEVNRLSDENEELKRELGKFKGRSEKARRNKKRR